MNNTIYTYEKDLPLSTSFTVDIELADGKHITSTTPAVTIE